MKERGVLHAHSRLPRWCRTVVPGQETSEGFGKTLMAQDTARPRHRKPVNGLRGWPSALALVLVAFLAAILTAGLMAIASLAAPTCAERQRTRAR